MNLRHQNGGSSLDLRSFCRTADSHFEYQQFLRESARISTMTDSACQNAVQIFTTPPAPRFAVSWAIEARILK